MIDDAFDALADEHRRQLLVDLLDHNPQDVSRPSVAFSEASVVDEGRVRARHVHLPKLAEYGFIEWDQEEQVATKGPRFDELRPLLELLDEHRGELPEGWP